MLRGRSPVPTATVSRDDYTLGFPIGLRPVSADVTSSSDAWSRSGRQQGLVFESLRPAPGWRTWRRRSHNSRTLWPGGSRSEWRPGCWPSASPITPSGPGHCWYASPKNGHVKVRDIALAMINAHCGQRSPAEVEILSVIEMQCPTAYAQSVPEWSGISPPAKFAVIGARHVPAHRP
jgi:hypothetical protein